MPAFKDLSGQRFGRWIVLRRAENRGRVTRWLCRCECGVERNVDAASLTYGVSRSCGCLQVEMTTVLNRTHGKYLSRAYRSYCNAKDRCTNPKNPGFRNYGGRQDVAGGIQFLFTSFEQFFAGLGERPNGMSLGRIKNEGHYEPGNVEWQRPRPQANNTRQNRPITAFGVTHNLRTWGRMLNMSQWMLWKRLKEMPVEQALLHVCVPPGAFWLMDSISGGETCSTTGSWEWRPYVPPPMTDREVEIAYAIEAF